jgi:tetratricopeptide (TPR) repeat protein
MSSLLGTVAVTLILAYILYVNIPTFYSIKGNKEINDGNYEKALLAFKKAVDTKRASGAIHLSYGMLLLRCGKPEDSVSVFNSIILYSKAKDNIKHQAKQYRVLAYHKLGQTEDALEEAQEIFESYKNTISYGLLCYLKLANNQPIDEVLPLCEEAYDYNSDDRDIVDNLTLANIRKGNYEKAKELVDTMLEKFPAFTEAYYHGAVVYKKLGDINKARELLNAIQENCRRTYLTTVSLEEIEELKNSLN